MRDTPASRLRFLVAANVPPDPNSGAAGTVYHTNLALRELGHDVDEIWESDLRPRRIRHGNLHSLLEQPRSMRRAVLKRVANRSYDVVMMSQPQSYLAAKALKKAGFEGAVLNRSHGVEFRMDNDVPVWHKRLGVRESRAPMLSAIFRRLLQTQWYKIQAWCDGFVVTCEDDKASLIDRLSIRPERVLVSHHGAGDEFITRPVGALDDERRSRLLYVGQYSFIKGPHILVRAVARTLAAHPDATMTWVTSASSHSAIREMFSAELLDRVRLVQWTRQQDLVELYDQHGIFLLTSFMEGAGKVCLEAMSRGLCVISSDTGGMRDYITPKVNGLLCPVGDVGAFVQATTDVMRDAGIHRRIGERARASSLQYSWHACATRICDFVARLKGIGRSR